MGEELVVVGRVDIVAVVVVVVAVVVVCGRMRSCWRRLRLV